MVDAASLYRAIAGVEEDGTPQPWRFAFSRHPRNFNEVVKDPNRGPWTRKNPDGAVVPGHTDAYEQIVPINEQIAWVHRFSDGITRDSGDVLMELMEFVLEWRTVNKRPLSAFTKD
jgi:hypothetical protein